MKEKRPRQSKAWSSKKEAHFFFTFTVPYKVSQEGAPVLMLSSDNRELGI